MTTIVIGVMPQEQTQARAIAIATGEYKPKSRESAQTWLAAVAAEHASPGACQPRVFS
jgi:hypothetical protein